MCGLHLAVISLLASIAAGAWTDLCSQNKEIDVEAMVFSGMPNPHFLLTDQDRSAFCNVLNQSDRTTLSIPSCTVLGFTGWYACVNNQGEGQRKSSNCMHLLGSPAIDNLMFDMLNAHASLHHSVVESIANETARLHRNGGDSHCAENDAEWSGSAEASCNGPIRGPDSAKSIHYDPRRDLGGCFITKQSSNNCYNYATDILTNRFAQPGGGVSSITCDRVFKKAESDGLVNSHKKTYPKSLPTKGHYVALMAYKWDFHWLREDANGYYSHKPGSSRVKNTDNGGQKIQHPEKHNWSPYHFCGYMRATPSQLRGPFGRRSAEEDSADDTQKESGVDFLV
jgi:hypothetical protein